MELLASLENSGFGIWLRESPSIWAYPTVLTLHTLGLGVLVWSPLNGGWLTGTQAAQGIRVRIQTETRSRPLQ